MEPVLIQKNRHLILVRKPWVAIKHFMIHILTRGTDVLYYIGEEVPYEWFWDSQDFGVHEIKVVAHAQYGFNASGEREVFRLF